MHWLVNTVSDQPVLAHVTLQHSSTATIRLDVSVDSVTPPHDNIALYPMYDVLSLTSSINILTIQLVFVKGRQPCLPRVKIFTNDNGKSSQHESYCVFSPPPPFTP